MPTAIVLEGLGYFLFAFLIHICLWRTVKIKKEIFWLFFIFLFLPLTVALARFSLGFLNFPGFASAELLSLALALAYMQTYPTFRKDIPTFRILLLIHDSKGRGLSMEEVLGAVHDDSELFFEKIDELENDKLVTKSEGYLTLSPAGRLMARVFIVYRRLLGFETGPG